MLRAMNATTKSEKVIVKAEKVMDCTISSQASGQPGEGPTTSASTPATEENATSARQEKGKYVRLTATADQLRTDYERLGSTVRVAALYGVSKKCVLNRMKKLGIARNVRGSEISYEQMLSYCASGMTIKEIAEIHGVSGKTVSNYARKFILVIEDKYHPGYVLSQQGYKLVKAPHGHPYATASGYIREHRLVMERQLGRILAPAEVVHHVNGDKMDNRPDNLEIMTLAAHTSLHHKGKTRAKRVMTAS